MKISQIVESVTSAGSIATVESPLGTTQTRMQKPPKSPKVAKGRKFANTISEGKMKDLAYDLQHMDAGNFKKKYGKTKDEMKASLTEAKVEEAEITEADLIVVPGMRKMKDTSFIPHKADRRDHEVEMARSDLYAAAKDAMRIFKLLKGRSEDEGLMGWQQSYITLAADYLNSVADSIEYNAQMKEDLDKMTGGVIAGGMSNFEEDTVNEISDFKRKELEWELRNEPKNNYQVSIDGRAWKVFADKAHAEAVARKLRAKGKKAEVYVTGASVSETQNVVNELSPQTKKNYAAAAKQDKAFNQRGIDQALDRAARDQYPGRAEWEDEAEFLKSVNAKRDRGLKRAEVDEAEKQGLWANIHAKRERIKKGSGERMRKPGSKGAPTAQAFKQSQKTSKKK